ncbi:MAG: thioredoxin domain-containing protein [Candidatus Sericytochromatia bacterium]
MDKKYTNSLIKETSPYLLQHAHNPVDWYPWGEEAFKKAKNENKPIFLSVGYSACHWCHVMEHESFEDEETAKIMNKLFVNIKVDKEERPDVDSIYMNVVQMLTGHGGWPMSVFMTPDMKPFYGGTYYPKERRYNMPTFKEVLVSVEKYYREKKDSLEKNTANIIKNLEHINKFTYSEENLTYKNIERAIYNLENYFDYNNGGFGLKPKFPNTFNIDLLLRHYLNTNEKEYLNMVELTLTKMCNGGIYDHLGGGFFRYSVDEQWLIPHFEKMLYDNALLIKQLIEVYQITNKDFYKNKAIESLNYVIREMYDSNGGFYSTQDADSEGEEGKFYTWTKKEIIDILGEKEANTFCQIFDISEHGNFEHGKSNLQYLYEELNNKKETELLDIAKSIEKSRKILFEERSKRIYPNKDTKILTAWNGLMISTFAKAYQVLGNIEYLEKAEKSIDFIFNNLYKDGFLLRTYKDNIAKYNAYLEDYAFIIEALIHLYQVTFENKYLEKVELLTNIVLDNFYDEKDGGFFFTSKKHESLIVRTKEITDHSIPSANTIMIKNLLNLSRITENKNYLEIVKKSFGVFSESIKRYTSGVSGLLCVLDNYLSKPIDIVVVSDNKDNKKEILGFINKNYYKDVIYHFILEKDNKNIEITKNKTMVNNQTSIYICKNLTCEKPIIFGK